MQNATLPCDKLIRCDAASDRRGAVEQAVRDCFLRVHGAEIRHFHQQLLALEGEGGIDGVIGCSWALPRLFLEIYSDQAIEQDLSRRIGLPVRRSEIAEIGNLASSSLGGGRLLVSAMAVFLQAAGFQWCVFTGTRMVRATLGKFSDEILFLHDAPVSRLGEEERLLWGAYYAHEPQVNAAYLPAFVRYVRHQGFFIPHPSLEEQARQLGAGMKEPSR
ncbi:MAG: hypothetical protein RL095_1942 [Verrucomicrobiota bacterium]